MAKHLVRSFSVFIILAVLLGQLGTIPVAAAANFIVNSTADMLDANPGDGFCETDVTGDCTLRAAIQETNALEGADTITLPAGTYRIAQVGAGEDEAVTGDLDIADSVEIVGDGAGTTFIDADDLDRVFHILSGGSLTARGITIRNGNLNAGSGVLVEGTFTLEAGVIAENIGSSGGGVFSSGTTTITESLIVNNSAIANDGGGLFAANGTMSIINSTIVNNSAAGIGGGLVTTAGEGNPQVSLNNVTFSGNSAPSGGGGIYFWNGSLGVQNTIVADSASGGNCSGIQAINSLGNNISSDSSCDFTASGDRLDTNPLLGPLTDNGGPTHTMALLVESPAIDAGNNATCAATDQRGVARPQGDACDIGAFEVANTNIFLVTNTDDGGAGSLRQAILNANSVPNLPGGPDEIHFNISGTGVQTISPVSALPEIAEPVIIDGYTQPGASPNTQAVGNNAVLRIELDGTTAGFSDGLAIRTSNSVIRGLVINRFSQAGISVSEIGNVVAGNFIGTDPTGTLDRGNGRDGIFVANFFQPIAASDNTIGGNTPADRNLISANGNGIPGDPRNGITLDQVTSTFIYGNYIGTNAAGTAKLGNYQSGIGIYRGSNNVIGGSGSGQGNLISGNGFDGIGMGDVFQTGGHIIKGNLIGTNALGNPTLGNDRNGISLQTPNVTVGGANPGDGNTIAGNGDAGIVLTAGTGNNFRGNSNHSNTGLDIDLGGDGVTFNHAGVIAGPNTYQNYPVLSVATSNGSNTRLVGTLESDPSQTYTIDIFANQTCHPSSFGGGEDYLGSFSVATNASGFASFDETLTAGIAERTGVTATATGPSGTSEFSYCRAASTPNLNWVQAQSVSSSSQTQQYITDSLQEKWFKFPVQPGALVTVKLTSLPGSAVSLHRDPYPIYNGLINPQNAAVLSAEAADVAFLPSGSLPSGSLPSGSLPSGSLPSGSLPSGSLPTGYLPSGSLPSGSLPSGSLPSGSLPSGSLPSGSLPSGSLPSGSLPSGSLPSGSLPSGSLPSGSLPSGSLPSGSLDAYASAARRSLLGISMDPYATVQTIERNTYDLQEDLYVRVVGPASLATPFTLEVNVTGGVCSAVQPVPDSLPVIAGSPASGSYQSLILTDSSRLHGTSTEVAQALADLATLAGRSDVNGILIDLASADYPRVAFANTEADQTLACAFAKNTVANEIKNVIDAYREANPNVEYLVLAGGADVIPFFQVQDVSGLANEKEYVPPVAPSSASEAGLMSNLVQGQDGYGSQVEFTQAGHTLALPDLAIGRLVDTATDISTAVNAYIQTGGVVVPNSALVTGYDFVGDAAVAIKAEMDAGTSSNSDTLIQPPGEPPTGPNAWTADQLRTKLLGGNFDIAVLSGHFSAGSLLAADYRTQLAAAEIIQSTTGLSDVLVLALGCHGGYTVPSGDLLPGVSPDPDWAKAFLRKGAAGYISATGYAYGDTELTEYGERLFLLMAQQLRTGSGPVSIGQAVTNAKLQYLAETAQLTGIDQKTIVEMTLYGLPMMKVNMPGARLNPPIENSIVGSTDPVGGGPGASVGLRSGAVVLSPSLTTNTKTLQNLSNGSTVTTTYLSGPDGVVVNPFEPIYPKAVYNVSVSGNVLRGIALRSGSYTDLNNIIPLTSSPTTETSTAHLSYNTNVFYPTQTWAANYYDTVSGGQTRLIAFPAQFKSSAPGAIDGILRRFDSLDLQLYYLPANWTTNGSAEVKAAGVSAAPVIQGVSALENGSTLTFQVNAVAEGAAGVQAVWVLYTGKAGSSLHGAWAPLDLTQNSADPTLWEGTLNLPSGTTAEDVLFMVQAVGGAGLTTLDTNLGAYYSITPEDAPQLPPPAQTILTLQSPPSNGTYLKERTFNVQLESGGQPLAGQLVTLDIGGQQTFAMTDSSGEATLSLTLVIPPGDYTVQASYRGSTEYLGSNHANPFTVNKDTTTLTVTPTTANILAGEPTPFVAVVRDSAGRALGGKSVIFVIHNNTDTYAISVIADFQGNAALGEVAVPPGTYTVDAYFSGTIPVSPSETLTLSDDYYESSRQLGLTLTITGDSAPPTISASATKADNTPYTADTWTNQNVTVHFTCGDTGGSGIASCPADQTFSTEGNFIAEGTAADNAGNTASTSFGPIKIDKTPPSLNPVVSPNPVAVNGTATVTSGAADALSGLASQTCGALDTSTPGTKSVTCTAIDNAGNTATASASYQVIAGVPANAVLDNFNRANGKVGNNWALENAIGRYRINGNRLDVQVGGALIWKPSSFGANQEAFITLSTIDASSLTQGLILKAQSTTRTDTGLIIVVYDARAKAVRVSTLRANRPIWTNYGNTSVTFANGDQLAARALSNGTVEVYKNGALVASVTLNASDQTFFNNRGGRIGVWTLLASDAFFDNFGGGNVTLP